MRWPISEPTLETIQRARRGLLVASADARDRRMVGDLIGRDHAERDVVATAPLDPACSLTFS
jgi:hypothetical protein